MAFMYYIPLSIREICAIDIDNICVSNGEVSIEVKNQAASRIVTPPFALIKFIKKYKEVRQKVCLSGELAFLVMDKGGDSGERMRISEKNFSEIVGYYLLLNTKEELSLNPSTCRILYIYTHLKKDKSITNVFKISNLLRVRVPTLIRYYAEIKSQLYR